jgi:hypothetical protein
MDIRHVYKMLSPSIKRLPKSMVSVIYSHTCSMALTIEEATGLQTQGLDLNCINSFRTSNSITELWSITHLVIASGLATDLQPGSVCKGGWDFMLTQALSNPFINELVYDEAHLRDRPPRRCS